MTLPYSTATATRLSGAASLHISNGEVQILVESLSFFLRTDEPVKHLFSLSSQGLGCYAFFAKTTPDSKTTFLLSRCERCLRLCFHDRSDENKNKKKKVEEIFAFFSSNRSFYHGLWLNVWHRIVSVEKWVARKPQKMCLLQAGRNVDMKVESQSDFTIGQWMTVCGCFKRLAGLA